MAIFNRRNTKDHAHVLYVAIVNQARQPFLFDKFGVPDTVDGRFDMISLHVFLILRKLNNDEYKVKGLSQSLFDTMFADMDRSLREMGAGDLGVGKRVKAMATAFYGRLSAYEKAMEREDSELLTGAILRNVFRGEEIRKKDAEKISKYIHWFFLKLNHYSVEELILGKIPTIDSVEGLPIT